jgi:hypothetical protein
MSKEIDRRDFIGVILGTVSSTALSGSLSAEWPENAKDRPVADPIVFHLENGYVVDPIFDYDVELPTVRENRYEALDTEGAIEFFLDLVGYDEERIAELETIIKKPHRKWSEEDLPFLEKQFREELDQPEDPDYLSFRMNAVCSEYSAGITLLDELGDERSKELGLYLVEGEHPGSSFCGVGFDGALEELNLELVRRGLNLSIEQSA